MKIVEWIKKIKNRQLKQLNAGKKNELETSIGLKIRFDSKESKIVAELIKDEINENKLLYKSLLRGIESVNVGKQEMENALNIDVHEKVRKKVFIDPNTYEKHYYISGIYMDDFLGKVAERFKHPESDRIVKICRDNFFSQDCFTALEKEKYFLQDVINHAGNWISYCMIAIEKKDYEEIFALLSSKNDRDYEEKYINKNVINMLNRSVPLFKDNSCNYFIDKNIDIVAKAFDYSGNYKKEGNLYYQVRLINNILSEMPVSEEDMDTAKEFIEKIQTDDTISKNLKRIIARKNYTDGNKHKFSNDEIIELTKKSLAYIDSTGNLEEYFSSKIKEGRVIFYNDLDKEDVVKKMKNEHPEVPDKLIDEFFSEEASYIKKLDICIIKETGKITEIPAVVHECIHQYYENNKKVDEYSSEIPSVFFEKVCSDFLINNGYSEYKEELEDDFFRRILTDYFNNDLVIDKYIKLIKINKDNKEITLDDLMDDDTAKMLNEYEFEHGVPRVSSVNDIYGRKIERAKNVLKSTINRSFFSYREIRQLISYSLGTYFAVEYSSDKDMHDKILELTRNPDVNIQDVMNYASKDKRKEIEKSER